MSLDKPCDMSALCGSGSECRNRATPVRNESSRLLTVALVADKTVAAGGARQPCRSTSRATCRHSAAAAASAAMSDAGEE
jgi:hypothetical protein